MDVADIPEEGRKKIARTVGKGTRVAARYGRWPLGRVSSSRLGGTHLRIICGRNVEKILLNRRVVS